MRFPRRNGRKTPIDAPGGGRDDSVSFTRYGPPNPQSQRNLTLRNLTPRNLTRFSRVNGQLELVSCGWLGPENEPSGWLI